MLLSRFFGGGKGLICNPDNNDLISGAFSLKTRVFEFDDFSILTTLDH
jgi:hypothetical protein